MELSHKGHLTDNKVDIWYFLGVLKLNKFRGMLYNLFQYKLLEYFAYYAGIMLDALACLLCLKLCWHNQRKPTLMP